MHCDSFLTLALSTCQPEQTYSVNVRMLDSWGLKQLEAEDGKHFGRQGGRGSTRAELGEPAGHLIELAQGLAQTDSRDDDVSAGSRSPCQAVRETDLDRGTGLTREPSLSALLWSARACCVDPAPAPPYRKLREPSSAPPAGTRTDARGRACCLVGVMRGRRPRGNGGARTEKAAGTGKHALLFYLRTRVCVNMYKSQKPITPIL